MVSSIHVEPVSRTDQYKKVMKPLLERKRRARINKCLDELRDLLVAALQAEGETVTRLEKADILELTVRHVRRLNQRRRLALPHSNPDPRQDVMKFQEGFVAAARQVQNFLMSTTTLEPTASSRLMGHLQSCASTISTSAVPQTPNVDAHRAVPTLSPPSASPVHPRIPEPVRCAPVVPTASPLRSPPPPLIDLSAKSNTAPVPIVHKVIAPTPVRGDSVVLHRDPSQPQDLSMPKDKNDESSDAWRPW